ncbi:GRAM domain-containing protein 4-like isoform X2 [Cololabis saira]|uniref:GRAM domain-containing protein 4-like isoform X2 n=1 Tax=Cololabis saira TaxID=129043 RepID=UPI002AD4DC79|nr:GRAM domain-containing protein 4-like isoform X2 [Cololabis saira]
MLRRLDRIRFRGQRRDESPDLPDRDISDLESSEEETKTLVREEAGLRDMEAEQQSHAQAGPGSLSAALQEDSRTDLNEIKGHLEVALLEKHFLQEELRKLREESDVESLRLELEKERCRRLELEQKVPQGEPLRSRPEDSPSPTPKVQPSPAASSSSDAQKETLSSSFLRRLYESYSFYIEDFRFQPEETAVETEEPLSARRLTENMRRLKRAFRPLRSFRRNLLALSGWSSFYTSAIAFMVYMYAAWHGWTVPVFLFLAILRLSLNYLISRGWRIQWSIVPDVSEPEEPSREDLTVSEKFQLVLDVAQRAQNLFGKMADVLEKIKNLFMWVRPELTQKLYLGLVVAFVSSCLLPYQLLGLTIALYAGVKFFVVDYVFRSCPKLRRRYDTPFIIWTGLPTDLQLKDRTGTGLSRRVPTALSRTGLSGPAPPGTGRDEEGGRTYSTRRGVFHQVFSLPESERPLAGCEGGWRCCLINRDRRTPKEYIRHGILYATENHLCFESSISRSGSSKRTKVIRLSDITDVQKYKVLSVLPGSGMGISVTTPDTLKPMVFGAMIHRDEAFEAISSQHSRVVATATAPSPEA